jgi:hypothetical protein
MNELKGYAFSKQDYMVFERTGRKGPGSGVMNKFDTTGKATHEGCVAFPNVPGQ